MGALMIVCRVTGREIYTGIEMDEQTFADIPNVPMQTQCPHCGGSHTWWTRNARLTRPPPSLWPDGSGPIDEARSSVSPPEAPLRQ
jgi:hypothetical protein